MKKLITILAIAISYIANCQCNPFAYAYWSGGTCAQNISLLCTYQDTIKAGALETLIFHNEDATGGIYTCFFTPILSNGSGLLVDTLTNIHFIYVADSGIYNSKYYTLQYTVPNWHSGWYIYTGFDTATNFNNPPYYAPGHVNVYIENTTGVENINNSNTHTIKEVRYYNIIGQLYGIYPHEQLNLPEIPLIEEIIYTDNEVSTRCLIHI